MTLGQGEAGKRRRQAGDLPEGTAIVQSEDHHGERRAGGVELLAGEGQPNGAGAMRGGQSG